MGVFVMAVCQTTDIYKRVFNCKRLFVHTYVHTHTVYYIDYIHVFTSIVITLFCLIKLMCDILFLKTNDVTAIIIVKKCTF